MKSVHKTSARALLVAAGLSLAAVSGCDKDQGDTAPVAVQADPAPEAIEVGADTADLIFRYVDPTTGRVASATTVDEVPMEARAQVVVYTNSAPPPPGWDHVADLRELPAQTRPQQGFSLKTVRKKAAPTAGASPDPRRVVMFVRNGCGFCRKADKWLTAKKIPFDTMNLDHDPKAAKRLSALAKNAGLPRSRLNGVPIIFVGDNAIIGFDKSRLAKLLGV